MISHHFKVSLCDCACFRVVHMPLAEVQTAHDAHYFLGVHSDWLMGSVPYTHPLAKHFPVIHLIWPKDELLKIFLAVH